MKNNITLGPVDIAMMQEQIEPDWKPLEDLVGTSEADNFMFMGFEADHIRLYKHCDNRRYLCIDDLGNTYKFQPGPVAIHSNAQFTRMQVDSNDRYVPISKDEALARVGIIVLRG